MSIDSLEYFHASCNYHNAFLEFLSFFILEFLVFFFALYDYSLHEDFFSGFFGGMLEVLYTLGLKLRGY